MNRPSLVSSSKFSVSDLTVTPRPRSSPMVIGTCAAERPHRSDFQNTRVSPGRRAARALVNSGRAVPCLRTASRRTAGHSRGCAGRRAGAGGSGPGRRPGSRRWCGPPAASVRPGTSTFPDTLATSPDAVRKPTSEKTPGLRKGFVLALSRIKLSCIRRRVTAPRARFGARAERQPHPAPHRPTQVRVPENGPARSWTARRTSSIGTLAAGGIGNQSLQVRAERV
jgi:hypothetical protein